MKMRIEAIWRNTGLLEGTMDKDLVEYSKWLWRATKRGYMIDNCGAYLYIHSGEGECDFRVFAK